jgi:hypothetical protein
MYDVFGNTVTLLPERSENPEAWYRRPVHDLGEEFGRRSDERKRQRERGEEER